MPNLTKEETMLELQKKINIKPMKPRDAFWVMYGIPLYTNKELSEEAGFNKNTPTRYRKKIKENFDHKNRDLLFLQLLHQEGKKELQPKDPKKTAEEIIEEMNKGADEEINEEKIYKGIIEQSSYNSTELRDKYSVWGSGQIHNTLNAYKDLEKGKKMKVLHHVLTWKLEDTLMD